MAKGKIPSRDLSYIDFYMLFYVQIAFPTMFELFCSNIC